MKMNDGGAKGTADSPIVVNRPEDLRWDEATDVVVVGFGGAGVTAALHAAELPVHGVVLIGDQNRENRETIERFGHVRVIGEIPKLPNLHRTALMQVFMNHFDRAAFSQ